MIGADIDTNAVLAEVRPAPERGPSAAPRAGASVEEQPPGDRAARSRPARPALHARARDPQAGAPAPDGRSAGPRPRSARTTSRTRPTARCGRWSKPPAARRPGPATPPGWPAARRAPPTLPSRPRSPSWASSRSEARSPRVAYVTQHIVRLLELTALRRIADLKSKLQRTNPVEHAEDVQPDVRRAGRARGAPPQAARPDRRARSEAARVPPPPSRWRRGRRCWPGPRPAPASSPAPAPRSTCPAARGSRGSRSRPPTGTSTPTTLRVTEVGTWGEPRPAYSFVLDRARPAAGAGAGAGHGHVVLQRHVPIRGSRGVRVIARRAAAGDRALTWLFEYDEGIDPDDPFVEHAAQEALAAARGEVGD